MRLQYIHLKEVLPTEELRNLKTIWEKSLLEPITEIQEEYGRITFPMLNLPDSVINAMNDLANTFSEEPLSLKGAMSATYSLPYGVPSLPPHFDGDDTDVVVNFVLSSNTRWSVGLDESIHNVLDNGALVFNPNDSVHWRSHKEFKEGEYVSMIFFRYFNESSPSDYSAKRLSLGNAAFNKANKLRNSLS